MDIGFHHGRVHPHLASAHDISFPRDLHHTLMDLRDGLWSELPSDAPDGLIIGHGPAANACEFAIDQVGPYLADQASHNSNRECVSATAAAVPLRRW